MMETIALFGGSFNPSTRRHLEIGQQLLAQLPVTAVWYLVSPQNPFKSTNGMAPFDDRMAMARLNVMSDRRLVVTDIEVRYANAAGRTTLHTAETLACLRADYPATRFLWVVGADNFTTMHTWGGYRDIIAHHPLILIPRDESQEAVASCPLAGELTKLAKAEDTTTCLGWFALTMAPSSVNATACRAQLNDNIWPTDLRAGVARYALKRGIYRASPTDFPNSLQP
jgi:nicotinate-nucleotide adenylyltransferase